MSNKKIDLELLRAMMMGDFSPPSTNDEANDWVTNDLHIKKASKDNFATTQQQLDKCKKILDKAIMENRKQIKIIHGKGSGELKKQVHQLLKNHVQVRTFELDTKNSGQTNVYFK